MQEKRGSRLLKLLDRYAGSGLLGCLTLLLWLKSLCQQKHRAEPQNYLLVCMGAIGDLLLLTWAAKVQLKGKRVFLACTKANLGCARLYKDFYDDVAAIEIRSLLAIHRVCQLHKIDVVCDSTQWANIGPVQVGLARLLGNGLETVGFVTRNPFRNVSYSRVVPHSAVVHEVVNFMNLLAYADQEPITSNMELHSLLPEVNSPRGYRSTQKVLFHMWPSGARAYLKEWPQTYWIELARYFQRQGYICYLSGSLADKARIEAFMAAAKMSNLVDIAGVYDLGELSAFVGAEIECAVSVNTGILHLVSSLGVPLIGLHGPTNPMRWGPLGVNSVALLPESGNFAYLNYGFEYPADDVDAYALDQLRVHQVISAFEQLKHVKS